MVSQLICVAARLAERILLFIPPCDRLWVRVVVRVINAALWLMGRSFRAFIHPRVSLYEAAQAEGFAVAETGRGIAWEIATFHRGPNLRPLFDRVLCSWRQRSDLDRHCQVEVVAGLAIACEERAGASIGERGNRRAPRWSGRWYRRSILFTIVLIVQSVLQRDGYSKVTRCRLSALAARPHGCTRRRRFRSWVFGYGSSRAG